jgi:hypothetical protein
MNRQSTAADMLLFALTLLAVMAISYAVLR